MKKINPKRRVSRIHPLALIFWISIILIIVGLIVPGLSMLIWIGCIVIALYVIYFATWLYQELP